MSANIYNPTTGATGYQVPGAAIPAGWVAGPAPTPPPATLVKDPTTGMFSSNAGTTDSGMVPVSGGSSLGGLSPKQDPYTLINHNIASILSQLQMRAPQIQNTLRGGVADATGGAVDAAAVPYDPKASSAVNAQNYTGTLNSFAPALGSLQNQYEGFNTGLTNLSTTLTGLETAYQPQVINNSLVSKDGQVLGTAPVYNPNINPLTQQPYGWSTAPGQGGAGGSGSAGGGNSTAPSSSDYLSAYNGNVDPEYSAKVNGILSSLNQIQPQAGVDSIDTFTAAHYGKVPISGAMIRQAASQYGIDPNAMAAQLAVESQFGSIGDATKDNNPGGLAWANQTNATQGNPRPANEGGFYAKFKTPMDGLFAMAQNIKSAQTKASQTSSNTSSNTNVASQMVQGIATQVANGVMSYDTGYSQISSIPNGGVFLANGLLPAIQKIKPDFNVNQSNAQATALASNTQLAGTTSALVDKTNQTLDLLPDAYDKLSPFQKLGGSLVSGKANLFSDLTGAGKAETDNYTRILAEARASANAVLSTAASLGVVTGAKTADSLLPDNMSRKGLMDAIATIKDLEEKTKSALANTSNSSAPMTSTTIQSLRAKYNY